MFQRSLNDNVVYPIMTKSFIYDNAACMIDRGTDFARGRLECHLQRHFRKHGRNGYSLRIDIRKYYDNMPHEKVENMFKSKLPEWASYYVIDILRRQYGNKRGYKPGSQLVQIAGISYLNDVDHFIKEELKIKGYIRYMDDFVLIHESKEYLEYCLSRIIEELSKLGLEPNSKKTKIRPLSDPIRWLGFDFVLTETGKVLKFVIPDNAKNARRLYKRMKRKADRQNLDKTFIEDSWKCYRYYISKGDNNRLLNIWMLFMRS